jgi:hypothetical protein
MDWKTIVLIEHIFLYWFYSYYLLYKNKLPFKYYIPKINVLFNILCNQILGGFIFLYFRISVTSTNISQINSIDVLFIIIDITVLYIIQYIYYYLMCKILNLNNSRSHDNYINKEKDIKYPYTTINCHILQHIFVNIISVFIGTNFWYCSNNSVIIWVWLVTIYSIKNHANFKDLSNINDNDEYLKSSKNTKKETNKYKKSKVNKKSKKSKNNMLLLEDFSKINK